MSWCTQKHSTKFGAPAEFDGLAAFRGRIRNPAAPHRSFMSHIECESVAAAEFGLKLVQERIRWIVVTVWIGKIGVSIL